MSCCAGVAYDTERRYWRNRHNPQSLPNLPGFAFFGIAITVSVHHNTHSSDSRNLTQLRETRFLRLDPIRSSTSYETIGRITLEEPGETIRTGNFKKVPVKDLFFKERYLDCGSLLIAL